MGLQEFRAIGYNIQRGYEYCIKNSFLPHEKVAICTQYYGGFSLKKHSKWNSNRRMRDVSFGMWLHLLNNFNIIFLYSFLVLQSLPFLECVLKKLWYDLLYFLINF